MTPAPASSRWSWRNVALGVLILVAAPIAVLVGLAIVMGGRR